MKKMMLKFSRRERLYLIAGSAILLFGLVVYPATKAAKAYRGEQSEMLEDEVALLEDLKGMLNNEDSVEGEYEQLRSVLRGAGDWLFAGHENPIMTQNMIIKRLNELGPDLGIDVSPARTSTGDASGQMNLTVRGRGRYPEVLNFLYRIETHRPLIIVNDMDVIAPKPKPKKKSSSSSKSAPMEKTKDPTLHFRLLIEINCRSAEDGE